MLSKKPSIHILSLKYLPIPICGLIDTALIAMPLPLGLILLFFGVVHAVSTVSKHLQLSQEVPTGETNTGLHRGIAAVFLASRRTYCS